MEKCLDVYIKSLASDQAITKVRICSLLSCAHISIYPLNIHILAFLMGFAGQDWYDNFAVLRSEFDMRQLLDLLSPLSSINFNLCLKDINFDNLPSDLKAYMLLEMEEWSDNSSRETTRGDEKRNSSDFNRAKADVAELENLREELKQAKSELNDTREIMKNMELRVKEEEEESERLKQRLDEQAKLIRDKQDAVVDLEARLEQLDRHLCEERDRLEQVLHYTSLATWSSSLSCKCCLTGEE